jgi:DNA-directed RNA polymerase subunit N (RpoN/RPB10)
VGEEFLKHDPPIEKGCVYVKKNFWEIFDKLGIMFYCCVRITKTLKHKIMKNYKQLFKEGFTFNGKDYSSKSYIMNYYKLVEDILEGVHGNVPSPGVLSKMFMSTVYTEYDEMPESVRKRKLYKRLGNIFVLTNKDINGINSAVKRISSHMCKEVVIR